MGNYHRKAYLKHFEGYTELRDPVSGKIRRVYTAEYYQCGLSDHALLGRKWCYCVMLLISIGLWITVSLSGLPGTISKFVSLFVALTLIAFFFAVVSVFNFCTAPRKMTICEHRESSLRLRRSAFAVSITLLLSGIAELIFVLLHVQNFLLQEILGIVGYVAAAAVMFSLFKLEQSTDYLRISNENSCLTEEDDAAEITP